MSTYVKEYDWMWLPSGLNLSPAECRVYAYIYGLTESKQSRASTRTQPCGRKGYNGSVRQLAKDLGLSLGKTSGALKKLQADNRITLTEGVYQSVQIMNGSVHLMNDSVQKMNDSVQSVNESVQSVNSPLTTPLYKEINKEMERDNIIARNTIATQAPQPSSDLFEEFLSAYSAVRTPRNNGRTWIPQPQYLAKARELWDNLSPFAQRLLIRDIKSGAWYRSHIVWVIDDYEVPEPTNYNGSADLNRMAENNEMVVAIYCEIAGIYTRQDAEDYGMQILRPFKIQQ